MSAGSTAARSRTSRTWAEGALIAVSVANAIGFIRVFADFTFLPVLATTVIAAHLLAVGCRRLGWGTIISFLVSAGGLAIAAPLLLARDTTWYGLPTRLSWTTIRLDLVDAWDQFSVVKAPVPSEAGFLAAALLAVWVAAWLADTFAFRFDAVVEAIVPTAGIFLFVSVLARPDYRLASCALYLVAVFAFVAMHRAWLDERAPGWLADDASSVAPTVLRTTAKVGVAAVIAALVLGPALPGAGEAPLWDLDTGNSGGTRVTLSPLVDIRGRLVDQTNAIAFEVSSPEPAYWRLTALDTFDGKIWSSEGSYTGVSGALPTTQAPITTGDTIVQAFTIDNLSSIWLPAAFAPINVAGGGNVGFDVDSASLITDKDSVQGLTYSVTSVVPRLQPSTLAAADTLSISREMRQRYLQLPRDYPQSLRDQAVAITGRASNSYERALALQQFFRANFTYDLSVRAGHGEDAIESFLEERRGYCEQFAGTYAAFARSIGLPARVAVGFTPGELVDGSYVVRGQYAHAWPEVWFEGIGWVPFEPTPGRGAPGAESYTNVAAQQSTSADTPPTDSAATTAAPGGQPAGPSIPTGEELEGLIPGALGGVEAVGLPGDGQPSVWPRRALIGLGVLALLAVAWVVGVPIARRRQRAKRRRSAVTSSDRVLVAWQEAAEAFTVAGVPPKGPETYREFAVRASTAMPVPRSSMRALADDASAAQFSGDPLPDEVADRAEATAAEIESAVSGSTPITRKVLGTLDPRPLRKVATKRTVEEAEHPVRV